MKLFKKSVKKPNLQDVREYLKFNSGLYSPGSLRNIESVLHRYIRFFDTINETDPRRLIRLYEISRQNARIMNTSINKESDVIIQFYRWYLHDEAFIRKKERRYLPDDAKPKKAYPISDLRNLKNFTDDLRIKLIIDIMALCGPRISEVLALQWPDIIFEEESQ